MYVTSAVSSGGNCVEAWYTGSPLLAEAVERPRPIIDDIRWCIVVGRSSDLLQAVKFFCHGLWLGASREVAFLLCIICSKPSSSTRPKVILGTQCSKTLIAYSGMPYLSNLDAEVEYRPK